MRLAVIAVLVSVAGCGDGITAPDCERCDEMRVLTEKAAYRPGRAIVFTVTNRTSTALRYDWCSISLDSNASDDMPLYSPARRCGIGAGRDEVLSRMVLVAPGTSHRDSVNSGSGTAQSKYQLNIWLVDENGIPELGNPILSNSFEIFPGAGLTRNH